MQSEFIQKRKELRRRAELSSEKKRHRSQSADPVARYQKTEFWKLLLQELEWVVTALHEINFTGSISPFGEQIVRVSLRDVGSPSASTRTDLILDGDRIRCSVLNAGIYYLNFTALSDAQIAIQDIQRSGNPMDPRKTAEYVVERMLNILEWNQANGV